MIHEDARCWVASALGDTPGAKANGAMYTRAVGLGSSLDEALKMLIRKLDELAFSDMV